MQDDERKELLWPSWATNGNGSRYDALSDIDKEVWRKTRGQRVDADSEMEWLRRLAIAIADGSISAQDAEAAVKRVHG